MKSQPVSARIASIAHATEEVDKVLQAIRNICPENPLGKARFKKAKGHYGNSIITCHLTVTGTRKTEQFFYELWGRLSSLDRVELFNKLEAHFDQSATLHIRLDKQEALSGRLILREDEAVKVEIRFTSGKSGRSVVEQVKEDLAHFV